MPSEAPQPKVVIVAEHASMRFGGEASLPLHIFRGLRRRGVEAWMVVHERTREELASVLGDDLARVQFLPDTALNRLCWRLGRFLPAQLSYFTFGYVSRVSTQIAARRMARALVTEQGATVVHQPIPVSPRETSLLWDMGAPVVIGPMNGNMSYPPAFRAQSGLRRLIGQVTSAGRWLSGPLHWLMPGKRRAALLLVANGRTRAGLPRGCRGRVEVLVENGVDLGLWAATPAPAADGTALRFVFLGRLVDLKAVDVLLRALARMQVPGGRIEVIGDGPMRPMLEALAAELGLADRITFAGWLPQAVCAGRLAAADVLLMPSLHDCGGAVVLEAMACARPVIATDWGGPADYIDAQTGILVPPLSPEALVAGFAAAMDRLAADPALRARMGQAGRARIEADYEWDTKIGVLLAHYATLRRG